MTWEVIASMTPLPDDAVMNTPSTFPRIEAILSVNWRFSVTSGLVLVAGAPWLDDVLGPDWWLLAAAGAGVLGFGLSVRASTALRPVETGTAVMWADLAWVGATAALAPFVASEFTVAGGMVAWLVAAVVLGFAIAEFFALRAERRSVTHPPSASS